VELVHSTVAILRVAIEPLKSSDIAALSRGLQILNQADAHVEILGKREDQILKNLPQ
jgi:translation elongation factor EF-G